MSPPKGEFPSGGSPISAPELFQELADKSKRAFIDVRSEGEFAQGHFSGFTNAPILSDSERHRVGLTYKQTGQDEAIRLGHELVSGSTRAARIESWTRIIRANDSSLEAFVTCWRGGLRSQIACEWLQEAGFRIRRLESGYQALRNEALRVLNSTPELLVISGVTGSGKTLLLNELEAPKIDLEHLAAHRGSSFGRVWNRPQPPQATFENSLALEIARAKNKPIVVEDESVSIGTLRLPQLFKERMEAAPLVILEVSREERVRNIFREYVVLPQSEGLDRALLADTLKGALLRIERRLGGADTKEIAADLAHAFAEPLDTPEAHAPWIEKLLERYYDKLYRHSIHMYERAIAFQGDFESCKTWIQNRYA